MSIRKISFIFSAVALCALTASIANAAIIAGWDQNSNANPLAPTGFGFEAADFPQANDHGPAAGGLTIADFDATVDGNGIYTLVQSFAGSTVNDLEGAGAGGSFSFVGNTNNGAKMVFSVPTTGFAGVSVSWTQRGTSTGYNSRVFEYSTDGGSSWTDIGAYAGSAGALGSSFTTVSLDLSTIAGLNNNSAAAFRITYSGASSTNGNNRLDNFYVQGTEIPEPATIGLAFACLGGLLIRRK
jgi:hypothetical protein